MSTEYQPLCSDTTGTYKDIYRVGIVDEHTTGILWSTFLVFNELKRKGFVKSRHFDTFVATQCLQNNITPAKVENFLNEKMKSSFSRPTIKKHLKLFSLFGYLKKDKYGYQTTDQREVTRKHLIFRNITTGFKDLDHFHDSTLVLYEDHTFEEYRNSRFKNFFHFYASELIIRLYYMSPVSKSCISQQLNLSLEDVRGINEAFVSRHQFEKCLEAKESATRRLIKAWDENEPRLAKRKKFTRQTTLIKNKTGFELQKFDVNAIKEKHTFKQTDPNTHYSNRAKTIITTGCVYTKSVFGTSARVSTKLWGPPNQDGSLRTELKSDRYYDYQLVLHLKSNEDLVCDLYQEFVTDSGKKIASELVENTLIKYDNRWCEIEYIKANQKKQARPNQRHKIRMWDDSIAYFCINRSKQEAMDNENSSETVTLTQFDRAQDFIPGARKVRDANLKMDLGTRYSPWIKDNKVKQEHVDKLSQISMLSHTEAYVQALETNGWLPDAYQKELRGRNNTPLNSRHLYRYTFGIPTPNMFSWFRVPDGKAFKHVLEAYAPEPENDEPAWMSDEAEETNSLHTRLKKIMGFALKG